MLDEVEEVKLEADSPYKQLMTNPFTDEIFYIIMILEMTGL